MTSVLGRIYYASLLSIHIDFVEQVILDFEVKFLRVLGVGAAYMHTDNPAIEDGDIDAGI
jgi:hypothetical protein